jgi:hypothetical protein
MRPHLLYLLYLRDFSTGGFPPAVLLTTQNPNCKLSNMAQYSALMGKRIAVTYRAGDVILPATGMLSADSGKSIFLEESYHQNGNTKTFRWEIPYPCILQLQEAPEGPALSASQSTPRQPGEERALNPKALELKNRTA